MKEWIICFADNFAELIPNSDGLNVQSGGTWFEAYGNTRTTLMFHLFQSLQACSRVISQSYMTSYFIYITRLGTTASLNISQFN
jgi:hypothetical protein